MSTFQFLLDENVNRNLLRACRERVPEMTVWMVGEAGAPSKETPDPDILAWCEARGFSLVTNNRSTMPVHLTEHLAAGRHVPGIFILDPVMSIGDTAEELELLWGAASPQEYADRIIYIPVP